MKCKIIDYNRGQVPDTIAEAMDRLQITYRDIHTELMGGAATAFNLVYTSEGYYFGLYCELD